MARAIDYDQMASPVKKRKADLGTREPARIKMPKKAETADADLPSTKQKARQDAREEKKTLSQSLTEAAMVIPPGEGMIGKALKAGVSGAAAGATLGELLAKAQQEKMQKGRGNRKPRTVSEGAMK